MTVEPIAIETRRVRAPRSHGSFLVEPSPLQADQLLRHNAETFQAAGGCCIGGAPLEALRASARREIIALAQRFTAAYRDVPPPRSAEQPLIVTGHQPALYHPGVWFKNFLVDRLASNASGTAVNVIVDNDVAPVPSIAVPGGTPDNPRPARAAYDAPGPRLPWEMTQVQSPETFETFPKRLHEALQHYRFAPCVDELWPEVVRGVEAGNPLGLAISAARNRLEEESGLQVLDVPLSTLSQTAWFLQFVAAILADADRFREIYNASVREYRAAHKIRSQSHPVPDLERHDDWIEVPFWIWTQEKPNRRRLWVSQAGDAWRLSDREGWQRTISAGDNAVAELQALAGENVYLRTRALTTTTILRLAASDLFVHGIGGAQYDQVTDAIVRQFFGIEPPRFVTATATLHLPITVPEVSREDLRAVERQLRDARFNPQRLPFKNPSPRERELLAEHARLIKTVPELPAKPAWHAELQRVNDELRTLRTDQVARLNERRAALEQQLHDAALLTSREYSLVLHPLEGMRELLLDLADQAT